MVTYTAHSPSHSNIHAPKGATTSLEAPTPNKERVGFEPPTLGVVYVYTDAKGLLFGFFLIKKKKKLLYVGETVHMSTGSGPGCMNEQAEGRVTARQ